MGSEISVSSVDRLRLSPVPELEHDDDKVKAGSGAPGTHPDAAIVVTAGLLVDEDSRLAAFACLTCFASLTKHPLVFCLAASAARRFRGDADSASSGKASVVGKESVEMGDSDAAS